MYNLWGFKVITYRTGDHVVQANDGTIDDHNFYNIGHGEALISTQTHAQS